MSKNAPWWHAPLGCISIALLVRIYFLFHLDLDPMYGPGGVKSITALLEDYPQRDWSTWLMGSLLPIFQNDIELTARAVCIIGSLLSVAGLSLSAGAIAGQKAAWLAGLAGALYAPLIWTSLLVGADAPGTGLVWFGLGLLFLSVNKKYRWILILAPLGILLIILGSKVKVTALPAAAFVAIPPLLLFRRETAIKCLLVYAYFAALLLWGSSALSGTNAHVSSTPFPTLEILETGYASLRGLFQDYDVLPQLAMAALVSALIPGRSWASRLGLLGIGFLVSCYISQILGAKLRPRYLIPSTLSLLVLCGCCPHLWTWPRQLKHLPTILGGGLLVMLSFDSLAFHQSWSDLMHIKDGSKVATFPKAPLGWQNRYQKMSGLLHSDHSAIGISILHKLAQEHDLDSTLGVPLRDGREFHLRASSGLAAKAYRILDPNYCCTQTDLSTCAEDTFNQFKSAGGRLILPIVRQHHNRIPHQSSNFTNALIRMAQTEDDWMLVAPWWGYLDVEGDGMSPLPCQRPVRDGKGRKK